MEQLASSIQDCYHFPPLSLPYIVGLGELGVSGLAVGVAPPWAPAPPASPYSQKALLHNHSWVKKDPRGEVLVLKICVNSRERKLRMQTSAPGKMKINLKGNISISNPCGAAIRIKIDKYFVKCCPCSSEIKEMHS